MDKRKQAASTKERAAPPITLRAMEAEATRTEPPLVARAIRRPPLAPIPVTMNRERAASLARNDYHRTLGGTALQRIDGDGNERRFTLSFSSEEPYERWYGLEILDHAPGAVDLSRLNDIGCVLFNHNRDKVIGKILRAWLENNRGYAEIEFDTDAESEVICQKVQSGTLKGVSVGYRIESIEEVMAGKTSADGRFTGPCEIARKWWPFEISIVSVPADGTVGVGREAENPGEVPLAVLEAQLQINLNRR